MSHATTRATRVNRIVGLIAIAVMFVGCSTDAPFKRGFDYSGGSLSGPDFDNVTFDGTVRAVLRPCASCHSSGAGGWTYDGGGGAYDAVISVVNRNDPPNSPLLINATGGDGHGGGAIFSQSSSEYAAIVAWIEAGAPNN